MKNMIAVSVLALALATPAFAGSNEVDLNVGAGFTKDSENTRTIPRIGLGVTHFADSGFLLGGRMATNQTATSPYNLSVESEGLAGLRVQLGKLSLIGKGGVGFRQASERDASGRVSSGFPYYAGYGEAGYRINQDFTWNVVDYRYRNSFNNERYGFETHKVGTGVTFHVTENTGIYVNAAREFSVDAGRNDTNILTVGLKAGF